MMRRTFALSTLALTLIVLLLVAGCGGHKKTTARARVSPVVQKAQQVYTKGNWTRIKTNISMYYPYDRKKPSDEASKNIVDELDKFEKAHPELEVIGCQAIVVDTPGSNWSKIPAIIVHHKPQSGPCGIKNEGK